MRYREMRWPCQFDIGVERGGTRRSATLRNIARPGAMVAGAGPVAPGERLVLSLLGRRLGAEVRWARGELCGVRFDAPLSAAEVMAVRRVAGARQVTMTRDHVMTLREMR